MNFSFYNLIFVVAANMLVHGHCFCPRKSIKYNIKVPTRSQKEGGSPSVTHMSRAGSCKSCRRYHRFCNTFT